MRIKIISDGTKFGTKVVDADTGEVIKGITKVTILPFDGNEDDPITAVLEFIRPEMDIVTKVE